MKNFGRICSSSVMITWSRFAGIKLQPVQPAKTSPYDYIENFNLTRQDIFPPGTCLDLCTFSCNFPLEACAKLLFNPPLGAEAITWENFVLAKWNPGSAKDGSNFAGMKLFTYNRVGLIYEEFTALPESRKNETEFHTGQSRLCNHHLII